MNEPPLIGNPSIKKMLSAGAVFFCSHSGGKDSQAMYQVLKAQVPKERLIVIHAHLPEVEWDGIMDHIKDNIDHELIIVQANKTLLDTVRKRGMFPDAYRRWCTSDLKRGPIKKAIRQYCTKHNYNLVVDCMGMRAEESTGRAKRPIWKLNPKETNGKRSYYEHLPIHSLKVDDVFFAIRSAGQKPFFTYEKGMSRCSCSFCILGSREDLRIASELNPTLFQTYVNLEKEIGHTLKMEKGKPIPLTEYIKPTKKQIAAKRQMNLFGKRACQ